MPYQVNHTDTTNPAKPSYTVADQSLNKETDVTFIGKNYAGYGPVVAENFLHLLENFANSTAPTNPIEGQLWYDTGEKILKVYDSAGTWNTTGSIKKSPLAPTQNGQGDLWVDTKNQQLKVYAGSTWLLVGPQFSAGIKTGPQAETITDTNNVNRNVITFYSDNSLVAIVSTATFTPKAVISGFSVINSGINFSSATKTAIDPGSTYTTVWGTASSSDALLINGKAIASTNFLRSDVDTFSNNTINIRSNNGLSIGSDLNFNINTDATNINLVSKTSGNTINFKLNNAGTLTTVVHVDPAGLVGINNINPVTELDVTGTISASVGLIITGNNDSTSLGAGSIQTNGGLSVNKIARVGGDLHTYGKLYVNNLDSLGTPQSGSAILPDAGTNSGLFDIGSNSKRFGRIYANTIGNPDNSTSFYGTFHGSFSGDVGGSATSLASSTSFNIAGAVSTTADLVFDGTGGTKTFRVTANQALITDQTSIDVSDKEDQLLVFRPDRTGTPGGLRKIRKQAFFSNVATVPVGGIMPYPGKTAPPGFLFCDGSELPAGTYSLLFDVIGYTYRANGLLKGSNTFALPDLRGRFPLGMDSMDNNLTVPDRTNTTIQINAGGNRNGTRSPTERANNVTSTAANQVGATSGSEYKTLDITNLPGHKHNLSSEGTGASQYYAVGVPNGSGGNNTTRGYGMQNTSSTGFGLSNSGAVVSANGTDKAFTVMNPYLTINYIIFTGVF